MNSYAYKGMEDPASNTSDYHSFQFAIEQVLGRVSTATLVKVDSCTNTPGQLAAIGQVNVVPLVNQIDGYGNPTPHSKVYNLAYFRYQGGSNAVIIDPQPGDIGLAVFCDRDVSTVKQTKAQSNPGTRRRFDMADGIYIGLCLADKPNQYITFTNNGITIADKNGNKIDMNSNGITCTSKQLTNSGDIIAGEGGNDKVSLQSHTHSGVQRGGANTNPPVAE